MGGLGRGLGRGSAGVSGNPEEGGHVAVDVSDEGDSGGRRAPKVSSVLFIRSAIMAMLAIFLAAVALIAFFLAKASLTSQVDRLGYLVRGGILNRTIERLNVQLDEGSRCVTTLETVLVSVWTQQNVSTRVAQGQADASAWFSFGGCGAISGAGWVRPDGTFSFYQAQLNASDVEATRSNVSIYTFVNESIPTSGIFNSYIQQLNATTEAPLSPAVVAPSPMDVRGFSWFSEAMMSADRMSYVVFVNPNGRPALIQSRRVSGPNGEFLGEAYVMQYLSDLSTYLAQIELGGGYLYVTNNSIILADSFGIPILTQQGNSTLTSLSPTESSVSAVRDAALFLRDKLGSSPGNVSGAYENLHLGGGTYSIDLVSFAYKTLRLRAAVILPRSLIMGSIDQKTRLAIGVIVGVTVGITLIGFGLVCLFTGRVSREFQLRFELVQQLNARRQAEARSETKSRFLANMSHELRTPMAGIIGLLDILLADELTVEQELNLSQIKQCATSLLGLLNDVLDLGRIEAGKMTLAEEEFDLGVELESLVDLFSVQCSGKGIEIGLDLPDDVECTVQGDSARVRQIFSNLITNSIKFTKHGYLVVRCWQDPSDPPPQESSPTKESMTPPNSGSISSSLRGAEPRNELRRVHLFFEVEDTGTGIPRDQRDSVFESFVQADPSSTRLYGGSGLGLGITRSLVQMMGGKIEILDKEGPGTLIRFDLVFDVPRKSNSSCPSFRLSSEQQLEEGGQLATAGNLETGGDEPLGAVARGGFFGGLGRSKRRPRSPGNETWLGADEGVLSPTKGGSSSNPTSPGGGRFRQRSVDRVVSDPSKSPGETTRKSESDLAAFRERQLPRTFSVQEGQLAAAVSGRGQLEPIISGLVNVSEEIAVAEPVQKVRRTVVLGIPGVLGRGLAKAWLEKHNYNVVECEDWSTTVGVLESACREEPLEVSPAGQLQEAGAEALGVSERPEDLLVIFDIDLLKSSDNSPKNQPPTEKLASLKQLLYDNQKARVDWASRQGENELGGGVRAGPVKVAVGWLIETTTPSAMRHFLVKSGFPLKVGKPLYPTRLQKLLKMMVEALNEPPTLDATSSSSFLGSLPPLDIPSPAESSERLSPFYEPLGGPTQGRKLPLELQADLAKHRLKDTASWTFFDNRGARAPIPAKPLDLESDPQSWSTSPSGTNTSSGQKDGSGGVDPGTFAPPERTISLSVDIPEFSPPPSPRRKERGASPDSNFAFYSEGALSPISGTGSYPSASDLLYPTEPINSDNILRSLNKSSSFASSSSYETILRSQSSGMSSQSSTEDAFRGGWRPDKLSPMDELPPGAISELEDARVSRSTSPSPEISPVTPIVSSAFSSPSSGSASRQSMASSTLSPSKEGLGTAVAGPEPFGGVRNPEASGGGKGLEGLGGSQRFPERSGSGPLESPKDQDSGLALHRRTVSAQSLVPPPAKTSPEQTATKAGVRRSPPMLPLSTKALAGLHILVAEDTPVLQRLAVTLLTKLGADVVAVDNGLLAVQAVRRTMTPGGPESGAQKQEGTEGSPSDGLIANPSSTGDRADPPPSGDELQAARDRAPARAFDCLLMDCQMPQMDGYDATKAIRQMEKDTAIHLPIIALTAHAMVEDEQKCLSSGMDAYQIKPINLKLLVSTIKKLIGERRADRLSK